MKPFHQGLCIISMHKLLRDNQTDISGKLHGTRLQASDFIFASAAQPFDLMQYPLHRLLGTGHLAAAWSMWILKVALPFVIPIL